MAEHPNKSVTVIIPVYNCGLLLRRCLDSVFNQVGAFIIEVIVIDDGSSDNSADIMRNYPQNLIIFQQLNQGPASARNKGIEHASGKYIAFLDADDYWAPGFLTETVNFLEEHLEAIAVSVGQLHKIPHNPDIVIPTVLKNYPEKYQNPVMLSNFYEFWANHNHVCTGSVLMRSDIVKQTGGQRPELRITEDLEFWAYLATFGRWGFIPKILFVSDGGAITHQRGWLEKNRVRWASAPTPEEWEQRTNTRISPQYRRSFEKVRGKIARNLSYSMIMSGRITLAKQIVNKYNNTFPLDLNSVVFRRSSKTNVSWFLFTCLLRMREVLQSVKYDWFHRHTER